MRRRLRSAWLGLDRRGGAAVEMAAVLPVVLLMLWAMVDVYRLFNAQQALDFSVGRALRYAAVNSAGGSGTSISAQLTGTLQGLLGAAPAAGTVHVTVTFTPAYTPGDTVSIAATYAWTPLLLPDGIAGATLQSGGTVTVLN